MVEAPNRHLLANQTPWEAQEHYDLYHMSMEQFREKYPLRTISDITTKIARDEAEGTLAKTGELNGVVGYFDIETTHLYPDKGHILCAAIADDNDVVLYWRLDDFRDEAEMLSSLQEATHSIFDYIVTWNGKYFDIPWVINRLRKSGIKGGFHQFRHIDAMYMVSRNSPSRSLDYVSRSLGLQDEKTKKTPFDKAIWAKAEQGDKESMDYVVDHNKDDVILLARTFRRLRDGKDAAL